MGTDDLDNGLATTSRSWEEICCGGVDGRKNNDSI